MSDAFMKFIKILGRGKNGARTLTTEEAYEAMSMMLLGDVAPEQEGAFWMLIRIREETVEETVGFTHAVRAHLGSADFKVDLDWPAYAGKRKELPWFLLSALALSNAGYKVVMHGHSFADEDRLYVDEIIEALALPQASCFEDMSVKALKYGFVYMSLQAIDRRLASMMNLKQVLGLRSPINTVVRMMNPFQAEHSVHGVFHKGYDDLHAQACLKLGDKSVLVFRGGNGEAEVNPERDVVLSRVQNGELSLDEWPRIERQHTRNKEDLSLGRLTAHWSGEQVDAFGEKAVLQTLASVLGLIHSKREHEECLAMAHDIWHQRDKGFLVKQGA